MGIEISWGTTLYSLVVFAILYVLLKRYAFGPLLAVMQKRQESVEGELTKAAESRAEAEKLLAAEREALDKSRLEAQQIITRAKRVAEEQGVALLAETRAESERLLTEARREITREKEQALIELRDQVGALSVLLASKIIEKELDETAQKALVVEFMDEAAGRL